MKAFKSHEEGEEDRDGAMLGAYENDLFDAEKNMRSPLQSPMHSKSPQQQLQQQQFSPLQSPRHALCAAITTSSSSSPHLALTKRLELEHSWDHLHRLRP